MTASALKLTTIVSEMFMENTYIAHLDGRTDCLVVDPGLDPEQIIAHLDENGLTPAALLITHGHSDHIAGNALLKTRWPECPVVVGKGDAPKLTDATLNLSAPFGFRLVSPPADVMVDQGDTYSAAGFDLEVLAVPGHSLGHVVYLWKGQSPWMAMVGDVIFAGSIGRTDFPDGDHHQLITNIRTKLLTLPDDTLLYSGNGPVTTVGREKRSNPFVGAGARL
jgi:hydroxyacylglutathione hydrolase